MIFLVLFNLLYFRMRAHWVVGLNLPARLTEQVNQGLCRASGGTLGVEDFSSSHEHFLGTEITRKIFAIVKSWKEALLDWKELR